MAGIPGLTCSLTKKILHQSATLHNGYPSDASFPQIDLQSAVVQELSAIFVKHGAHRYFRLRILHRHLEVPERQIMLGKSLEKQGGTWTAPTTIAGIDPQEIHAHVLSVYMSEGTPLLRPSEFREGPAEIDIPSGFFEEVVAFLVNNNLAGKLGLEAKQGQPGHMIEFSNDRGSILLDGREIGDMVRDPTGRFRLQDTGWGIEHEDGNIRLVGETRCITFHDRHDKVVAGQLGFLRMLRDDGISTTQTTTL